MKDWLEIYTTAMEGKTFRSPVIAVVGGQVGMR